MATLIVSEIFSAVRPYNMCNFGSGRYLVKTKEIASFSLFTILLLSSFRLKLTLLNRFCKYSAMIVCEDNRTA